MEPEGSPSRPMIDEIHSNGGIGLGLGDVDDEPSCNTNTNNRPIISSGEQLDVEAYASLYQGRTKIMRLLFIADHCEGNPAMRLEALRMAYEEIKKGENTQLHRDMAHKIDGKLGPNYALDAGWCESVDRRAVQKKEKLESELNAYRVFFFSLDIIAYFHYLYIFICVCVCV